MSRDAMNAGREAAPFSLAGWQVDPGTGRLSCGRRTIQLEPKVMRVLAYLAARPGRVVSRRELERHVWDGRVVSYDAVTNAVVKLRKAFGDDPHSPSVIETLSKRGYRLLQPVGPPHPAPEAAGGAPPSHGASPRRRWLRWLGAGVAAGVLLVLALAPRPTDRASVPDEVRPHAIAVLPFDNVSGDPGQDYLADGVTDDVISGLARLRNLLVIARESAFVYRGRAGEFHQIARRLNLRYILHGSVRRLGDRLQIDTWLIDAASGRQLWAQDFNGDTAQMLGIRDRIVQGVVAALAVRASRGEDRDFGRPATHSGAAYDAFLQGRQRFYRYLNRSENEKARALFQRAIVLDAKFAMAYAMLAWTHAFDAMNGWSADRERSLAQALRLARKALRLDPTLPVAYFVAGLAYREQGEYVKALVEAEKAIEHDPNYANAHVLVATLLYYAGRPAEGLVRIRRAMRLNPHHPYNYAFHLGQAYFVLGRYPEAITAFKKGIEISPASERLHVWLAAAYAQAGNLGEARWQVEQVRVLNPGFSLKAIREAFPFKEPADRERFVSGLRKAGMTE